MERYNKNKQSNELINKRKRKILIRRSVLLIILMAVILCTLCLKLPYFNVAQVEVKNNKNISVEEINRLSGIVEGNNIFYINSRKVQYNILANPYINEVKIRRRLPDTIVLEVSERDAMFYIPKEKSYVILDSNGTVLEERSSIEGMDLVKIDGVNSVEVTPGKTMEFDDERKVKTLVILSDLIKRNLTDIQVSAVNINDLLNISVFFENMCVKIGNSDNIESKLDKALNIIQTNETRNAKGYIDVSFEGNPVLYIEK